MTLIASKNGRFKIVVGYLTVDEKKYIITADLSETPLGTRPPLAPKKDRDYFSKLPPDNPRRIAWENKLKHCKFPTDLFVQSTIPLHPGFLFEPFEKGKYRAYFIHDWQKSMDAWKPEIKKILKLDEKGKK